MRNTHKRCNQLLAEAGESAVPDEAELCALQVLLPEPQRAVAAGLPKGRVDS